MMSWEIKALQTSSGARESFLCVLDHSERWPCWLHVLQPREAQLLLSEIFFLRERFLLSGHFFPPIPIKVVLGQARRPATCIYRLTCVSTGRLSVISLLTFHHSVGGTQSESGDEEKIKEVGTELTRGLCGPVWLGPGSGAVLHETQGKLYFADKENGDNEGELEEIECLRKESGSQAGRD